MNRYQEKAQILSEAWSGLFGAPPTFTALVNAMAVAELETRMGDAWPGENNWGAVMKRQLSPMEAERLRTAGITAAGGDAALRAARALLTPGTNEALHRDSSPKGGPFFAWFWSFPTQADAARKFLQVLTGGTSRVRSIIDVASPEELARAMYEARYYEGFHANDPEANIRDYATAVTRNRAAIEAGLRDAPGTAVPGVPPAPPPPAPVVRRGSGVGFVVAGLALGLLCVVVTTRAGAS